MTIYYWPDGTTDSAFAVDSAVPGVRTLSDESVSPLNGDIQTTTLPGSRWTWTVSMPEQTLAERRRLWAFLVRLNGREHRVALWDPSRSVPLGTIPTTGVTVNAAAAAFAQTVTLATGVAGCTIKAGDWFNLGPAVTDQTVMCVADATADASGLLTVEFRNPLRVAVAAGTAVVLSKPKALYVLADAEVTGGEHFGGAKAGPLTFSLLEVFS